MVSAIHEQGSLVRAARVLSLGQPVLTRRLAALEARLQGMLFERNRRGVVATDLCRALLGEAGEILARMEQLERQLTEVRGGQVRNLTIAAGTYAAETIAILAAARMLAVHPSVRLRLVSANWADVPRMVQEREANVGVLDLSEFTASPDLVMEPLLSQAALFVVRPGHPLLAQNGLKLADILAWPFIFIGRSPRRVMGSLATAREAARAAGRLHPAFPALIHESPTIALAAVRHSDAVAAVTLPIAAESLRAGLIAALPFRGPWMALHWGIIRPRHRRPTEAEDAYLDLLRSADRAASDQARAHFAELGLDATIAPLPG